MTDWFRSWHGAPTDIKWLAVARRADVAPGMVVAVAWQLMDRASQAEERGSIEGYDAEELAIFNGCEPEQVEAIVKAMEERGIVTQGRLTAWERRQPKREDDSYNRVRKFRERQKTAKNEAKRTVTHDNAPETEQIQSRTDKKEVRTSDKEIQQAVDAWNELADEHGLGRVQRLTPQRKAKLRSRLKDCGGMEGWRHAMARIRGSPFLLGQIPGKDFRVSFNFVLSAEKFTNLMEGTYDGNRTASRAETSTARRASDAAMARVFGGGEPGDDGGEPGSAGCSGDGGSAHFGTDGMAETGGPEGYGRPAQEVIEPLSHAAYDRGGT